MRSNDPRYSKQAQVKGYHEMLAGIWPMETALKSHVNCENLAHWMVHNLDPLHPVYDLGCGKGFYLKRLEEAGFKFLRGYEGTPGIRSIAYSDKVVEQDITRIIRCIESKRGTVVCLEVMEHIPVEHTDAVMQNISNLCNGRLVLSWALPGQGGIGHVNEKDSDYVIAYARKYNFYLHDELTSAARDRAGQEINYFGRSIYVFTKVE